uniref:Uncharacterized protein n=1 Tax=viral metagenome TaxID=1070528 RepID=A0A6C0IB41_9ZZZZ
MPRWDDNVLAEKTRLETYRTTTLPIDITRSRDGDQQTKGPALDRINRNFLAYQNLNKDLSQIVRQATPQDIGSSLASVGQLQQDILQLKDDLKMATADAEVAADRESQIQQDPVVVSNYEGIGAKVGLAKPLNRISVALLIGSGLFLIIVSVLLFKENILAGIPPLPAMQQGSSSSIVTFFKDPRVWGTLFGSACIVILFLTLKIAGKLPILP